MEKELHVVFGAGQIGPLLAARLLKDGKRVRVARRSSRDVTSGAELVVGDANDPQFCRDATRDAAVVYHCINPPYDAKIWADSVPRYMENLIGAAGAGGARLVVLDNIYMLGRSQGRPMNEDTPMDPCSKKGEIRARTAERLFEAHRAGNVRAICGRASDFYGPGGTQTHLGDYFWRPVLAGKTAWSLVNPDAVHTYHFIPDVADGLATLGHASEEDLGKVWMLPCLPATSIRELAGRFSTVLGQPVKVAAVPLIIVKTLATFVPLLREMGEMLYQWSEPFVVDDRRFRERFGVQPTAANEAAQATVQWAKQTYR